MATTQNQDKTMSRDVKHIIERAQGLVDATSDELDDRIKSARNALKERLELAKGEFGVFEAGVADKARNLDEFIHAKPYYALGGTFFAGLFLGWFMSRK